MGDTKTECSHFWLPDMEEMRCFYCGRMLYRNFDTDGPKWIPATPAEEYIVNGYKIDVTKKGKGKGWRKSSYW